MNNGRWIVFGVIVAIISIGVFSMSTRERLDVNDFNTTSAAQLVLAESRNGNIADHFIGRQDNKVILIEYGDYQCPGCQTAAAAIKQIVSKYEDSIAFVFRHYPLSDRHPNARAAATAAEAAGFQGKFWEMHEIIFERQDEWSRATTNERNQLFLGYAKQLDLDIDKFKVDFGSERIIKKINFDMALGRLQGVDATPSFFLDSKRIRISDSYASVDQAISQAIGNF